MTEERGGPGAGGAGDEPLTRVGVRGGGTAVVDRAGRLRVGSWSLDWWVGADDRWHRARHEVVVRQQRVGGAPVVETRLRVPGGDVVQLVYGARLGGPAAGDHVIAEYVNHTPVPVALALVLTAPAVAVLAQDGAVSRLDGAVALIAPRAPARLASAASEEGLFAAVAGGRAEDFDPMGNHELHRNAGRGPLALLWPLTHSSRLAVAVPLGSVGALPVPRLAPGDLPSAEQVSRGWRRQLEAGAAVELPDPGWTDAVAAARCELLLGVGAPSRTAPADRTRVAAAVVRAGARWGHDEVVAAGLADLHAAIRGPGSAGLAAGVRHPGVADLAAAAGSGLTGRAAGVRGGGPPDRGNRWPRWAGASRGPRLRRWKRTDDLALLVTALAEAGRSGSRAFPATGAAAATAPRGGADDGWRLEVTAEAVAHLERALRRGDLDEARVDGYRAALDAAAELLQGLGQAEAAEHVRRLHPSPTARTASAGAEPAPTAAVVVAEALARASATWTWADPGTVPELLGAVRTVLLDDTPDGLRLFPGWPAAWWGAAASFHRLPSRWGVVSAALRWHGPRPALLWEIDGAGARSDAAPGLAAQRPDRPVTVRAPALDGHWSAEGWRGEALLAEVPAPPGVAEGRDGDAAVSFR